MQKSLNWLSRGMLLSTSLTLGACGVDGEIGEALVEPEMMLQELNLQGLEVAKNPAGIAQTVHSSGAVDRNNPFFQAIGANLRTCESCHAPGQGWTITADATLRLFRETDGLAPVFMTHDAGSRPDADITTLAARSATFKSTLVKRGLIRFARTINPAAEFSVAAVADPYGFSTAAVVSSFRRPTPTANEAKVVSVTWTGGPHDVPTQLAATANGAARFHMQRPDVVPVETTSAMRDFQLGVFFAQVWDNQAGRLDAAGARGGPAALQTQVFTPGVNDIQSPSFSSEVFDIFDAWAVYDRPRHDAAFNRLADADRNPRTADARASIYRGQELFNHHRFNVTGVTGLNDVLGQPTVSASCSTCHNAPNVGGHSVFRMFDIGTADEPDCGPELPLITLQNKTTLATRKVCDMGRATSTGKWVDIGGFRAPPLRGLAARAPYFHDGQAKDLEAVVKYYDKRFRMRLSGTQKKDLEAFLGAL